MRQRQRLDPVHHFRWRGLRVALVDRRQVFQPLEALRLKPPLPFVEAGPVQAALATRLGDVAQFPRQFNDDEPLLRELAGRISRLRFICCRRSSHGWLLLSINSTERRLSGQLIGSLVENGRCAKLQVVLHLRDLMSFSS